MKVDLRFPASSSKAIPSDHAYPLFSALSRRFPQLHKPNCVAIHPICGNQLGDRRIRLTDRSELIVRCNDDGITDWLPLAGTQIDIVGAPVTLRSPRVVTLCPSAALRSRLVTIKGFMESETFQRAVRRQLDSLGVSAEVSLMLCKRRTLRVKDKEIVGFELVIEQLTADESIVIQEHGIGGRRHMGCGIFVRLR